MNDDRDTEQDLEDIRLENAYARFQQGLIKTLVRVAHCHECGHIDAADPYRPLCDLGHIMQPCSVTKYRLLTTMAAYN
jgi:hypothetical protein